MTLVKEKWLWLTLVLKKNPSMGLMYKKYLQLEDCSWDYVINQQNDFHGHKIYKVSTP